VFGIFEHAIGYGLLESLYILVDEAEVFVQHVGDPFTLAGLLHSTNHLYQTREVRSILCELIAAALIAVALLHCRAVRCLQAVEVVEKQVVVPPVVSRRG